MKFKAGNIARLKSGGPNVTVESVTSDGVWCLWFEGKRRNSKLFPISTLERLRTRPIKPPNITIQFVDSRGNVAGTKKLGDLSN